MTELAGLLGGEVSCDGGTVVTGVAGIREAAPGDITFVASHQYAEYLPSTRAAAVIRPPGIESTLPSIVVEDPHIGFIKAIHLLSPPEEPDCVNSGGVHETAIVDPGAELGHNVTVGPYCRVGPGATIGSNTRLIFGVWVGREAKIGGDCLFYQHVVVRERCEVGDRVIVHPGVIIGSDGFGFAWDGGKHLKVPQVGIVVVEDDVEIGSNTVIDRATTGATRIGRGTKIDNLVQIGHNCVVGEHGLLAGQAGISGSTELGNHVSAGGQTGFVGHIKIGDGVSVGAQAGVTKSTPPGTTVLGFPAREVGLAKRIYACTARLPELFKRIRRIESALEKIANGKADDAAAEDDR
ncbi:MAG: UDP-3-O-(3-hydroxymyristoyl)glucosamine N-acyltransferase [bacterium]